MEELDTFIESNPDSRELKRALALTGVAFVAATGATIAHKSHQHPKIAVRPRWGFPSMGTRTKTLSNVQS